MDFVDLWNFPSRTLWMKTLFPTAIILQREGKLRVDVNAGLQLLDSVIFSKCEGIAAQVAPDPWVVLEKGNNVSGFLPSVSQGIFYLEGRRGSGLYLAAARAHHVA